MAVKLEFVGHACFRLWEDNRPSIVMDPYGQTACGLVDDGFRLATDTVIVSSLSDAAHSNVELVTGAKQVINALDVASGRIKLEKVAGDVNPADVLTKNKSRKDIEQLLSRMSICIV